MLLKRIIPCLDTCEGRVVKGIHFEDLRDIDDPVALARYYNDSCADELAFYDITASVEKRVILSELIERAAHEVSIPLVVGGGIQSLDDIERVLNLGASKVSINTGAINDSKFIEKAAAKYGSPRIVLAMDVKRSNGQYRVYIKGGREDTGIDALDWAKHNESAGASELIVNSIDADGARDGYDLELLKAVCDRVSIPVVASGGAGCKEHFLELFNEVPEVDAALAASIFHLKEVNIGELKNYLADNGVGVRL